MLLFRGLRPYLALVKKIVPPKYLVGFVAAQRPTKSWVSQCTFIVSHTSVSRYI